MPYKPTGWGSSPLWEPHTFTLPENTLHIWRNRT